MTDQGRDAVARRDRPRARRPSVPLHRLREDRRRGRADPGGQARRRRAAGRSSRTAASAQPLQRYQGAELALGDAAVRRRHRRARAAPRRRRAVARTRARGCVSIDVAKALALPGVVGGRHRRGRAGRPLGRPDLPGLAGASSPRARRCAASATCSPRSPPRRRASPARRRSWSRSSTSRCPPVLDPGRGDQARRAAGQSEARQRAVGDALRARRRRRGAGRLGPCGHRHLDDAAHRAPVPRAGGVPRRAAARRPPAPLQPGPGHLRRPPADRRRARRAGGAAVRRAGARTAAPSAARRT